MAEENTYKPTNNSLADALKWLSFGDYVHLHSNNTRHVIYYDESTVGEKSKLIQINLTGYSESLLDEGEWEWYIKNAGYKEYDLSKFDEIKYAKVMKLSLSI